MPSLLSNLTCFPTQIFSSHKTRGLSLLRPKLKSFFILISTLLSSCSSQLEDANRNFLKQYSKQVETINTKRDQAYQAQMESGCQSSPSGCAVDNRNKWKEPATIFGINNSSQAQNASIDTSKIVMPKPPEEFLPDAQTLMQGGGQKLPDNMFEVSYNLFNFPESYGRPRVSFDDINIPKHDAFGVRTELGEKNYQLVGNRTLQRDIDFTKQLSSQEDREVSLELIKQEKRARKKGKPKANEKEPEIKFEEIKNNPDKITNDEKTPEKTEDKTLDNIVGKVTDQIKTIVDTTTKLNN
jgi:hypothetical protein